ncbi:MAG: hypothetical protein CBR30_06330 [Dictyoglomus sp. NZ13-RE01]|nr:MAG: hypothetical protein CBR30_06330 [Dictyoglomus sp. NZ13-RE01]
MKKVSLFLLFFLFVFAISGCTQKDTVKPQVSILSPQDSSEVSGVVTIEIQVMDNIGIKKGGAFY